MGVSYYERQQKADREYEQAWDEMSAEERQAMADAGIEGPVIDDKPATHKPFDESYQQPEKMELADDRAGYIGELLMILNRHHRPALAIDALLWRSNHPCFTLTLDEIGAKFGTTRQNVQSIAKNLGGVLDLPPARNQKRKASSKSYKGRNKRNVKKEEGA